MKYLSVFFLIGIAALAGCSTAANNGNNANMRGTNTNTGYVTSSETNVKPVMPANVTNISPPSVTSNTNSNSNHNTNHNSAVNTNSKVNMSSTRKP